MRPGRAAAARGHHPVAGHWTGHRGADPGDDPGGLHAKRHRRLPAQVPAAGAGDLVPVPHPAAGHCQQHLIGAQRARPGQLKKLNRSRVLAYPRCSHTAPLGVAVTMIVARRCPTRAHRLPNVRAAAMPTVGAGTNPKVAVRDQTPPRPCGLPGRRVLPLTVKTAGTLGCEKRVLIRDPPPAAGGAQNRCRPDPR